MSDNVFLLRLVQESFESTKALIDDNQSNIEILKEKTEKSGETDGFRQYLFADLPFAVDGMTEVRFAFVTDGLDDGETTGNGTGCLAVYKPALDAWRTIYDNTDVAN